MSRRTVLLLSGVVAAALLVAVLVAVVGGRSPEQVAGGGSQHTAGEAGQAGLGAGAVPTPTQPAEPEATPAGEVPQAGAPGGGPVSNQIGIASVGVNRINGRYCGSTLRYRAEATISVLRGPVTVKYRWTVNGANIGPPALQWVVFNGTGPQAQQVTQDWQSGWGLEATLQLEVVEWETGPGVGVLEGPEPVSRPVAATQCVSPDIDVEIVSAQVVPAPCGQVVQLVIVTHVTLGHDLTPTDGEIHLFHNLQRSDGYLEPTVVMTFVPGGATVLGRTTMWTVPAVLGYQWSFTSRASVPSAGISWSDSGTATVICV